MSKLETFLANWMSQYRHPKPNFRSTMEITKTPRALSQTRPSLLPDLSLKNRAKPFKDGRFLTSDRSLKREREFRSSARFSWFSMLNLRFPSNLGNGIENKLGCNIWCQRGWDRILHNNKNLNPCTKKEKCFNCNKALFEKEKCFCQRKSTLLSQNYKNKKLFRFWFSYQV